MDKNYWDNNVIVPIKRHFNKEIELQLEARVIEQLLQNYYDADTQEYILDELDSIYRGYCLGEWEDYWLQNIMNCMMQFDQAAGKVIPTFNLIEAAVSWAKHSNHVRVRDFVRVLNIYDDCKPDFDWAQLEERVNEELRKLRVYGDRTKCGYLALLHGYTRIRRATGSSNRKKQNEYIDLIWNNWDFITLVYSVMIGRICDNGNRDFAAIANNMRVLKSKHQFIHIFYAALKERINELCDTEEGKEKINKHLKKISEIEKNTPQDYETLDGLCSILFDELPHYLDKNRIKSYDEVVNELQEMKARVDSLNSQIENMAQRMADAVNASIPVEDIENELLRLQPGTGYDVYTQVNSLLTGNKAWMERANDIKHHILEKRDNPTIIKGNYYASGSLHDDKSRHIEIDKKDDLPKLPNK